MFNLEFNESWLRKQIVNPETNQYLTRSWFKYAKQTSQFSNLQNSDALEFCKIMKEVGQKINRENERDVIKDKFPGIYEYSKDKWIAY